ncbi:MAG: hydantoinase/oxoprolinase family protein [Candidatus Saccharibacteria bacterium]
MYIGIDVGGTFTDGVLFEDGKVIRWIKELTEIDRLQETILTVLDGLLADVDASEIKRLVVSTTTVTNLFATGRLEKAALVVIPGPGLNPNDLNLADDLYIVKGAIDFRGREIEKINPTEVEQIITDIKDKGIKKAAIVGKFAQRNPVHEQAAADIFSKKYPECEILMGHQVSGRLNFPRRAVTAVYTLATQDAWIHFTRELEKALAQRNFSIPVEFMKADAGTMSMDTSRKEPCQTVFSGPAASTMGAFALTLDDKTSVVVDIGGTTSDLALILGGKPLYASKGARIEDRYTQIKALAVRSIALGGDSVVRIKDGQLTIGPDREGLAACFGGPSPTPTDAFNVAGEGQLGDIELSRQALASLTKDGDAVQKLAEDIVKEFVDLLGACVSDMLRQWEEEPLYKVWEIVNKRRARIDRVIGIGAAAPAFIPILAERMKCEGYLHEYSPVANALGAAVARPTIEVNYHADTQTGLWSIDGASGRLKEGARMQMDDARRLAQEQLASLARERQMEDYLNETELLWEEQFNTIRGWSTSGKIFDVGIGIAPGVILGFQGVKA